MSDLSYRLGEFETRVRFLSREQAPEQLSEGVQCLWVFDSNTRSLVDATVDNALVLPPGEQHKSWTSVDKILYEAVNLGLGRDACFVGCGGGVVCDLCAFAASIYMRGARLVLIPTTLLAMVDAALGGKTGMDYGGYKNMVGTFFPASEVRVVVDYLRTLPEREFRSGMAEVIKHSLLVRNDLKDRLRSKREKIMRRDPDVLAEVIPEAMAVKGEIVAEDLRETGRRATLNLGHTFAHALESAAGFAGMSHGEAVGWGIEKALRLGVRIGVTPSDYASEVTDFLRAYGFRLDTPAGLIDPILAAMHMDKKKRAGRVRFILQRDWGDTFLREVDESAVREVLVRSVER